jgi:hypothetical protein
MGKFKVGDRVRVIDERGGRKIGDIAVVSKAGDLKGLSGGSIGLFAYRLEPAPPLTITAGKFYKTRDGRKVGPMEAGVWGRVFYDSSRSITGQSWNEDGSFIYGVVNNIDIIAEWVDEPVAVAPAKPKFKVGDRVKCTIGMGNGKVKAVNADGRYKVDWDNGDAGVTWWDDEDFDLISSPTAIVALIENDQPKPATRPCVHIDQATAAAEASRLALKHPGQEFGVFVLADSKIADIVTTQTAVLRAA